VRTTGDERLGKNDDVDDLTPEKATKRTLQWYKGLSDGDSGDGHDVQRFRIAGDVNEEEAGAPSHRPGTIVMTFNVKGPTRYVKIYGDGEGDNPYGRWFMKPEQISDESAESIRNRFALKDDWQEGNYRCVAVFEVPPGSQMDISVARGINDESAPDGRHAGGGIQYHYPDRPMNSRWGQTDIAPLGTVESEIGNGDIISRTANVKLGKDYTDSDCVGFS